MQPPTNMNGSQPTNTQSQFNITPSVSNAAKSCDTNYGPYTDEFNQPRTSFEGISQFFDDHMSQAFGEKVDSFSPFANESVHTQVSATGETQHQNHPNQIVKVGIGEASNSQQSANQTSLFNLDSQNTVTLAKATTMIPNLPSGISLTPVGAKIRPSGELFPNQGSNVAVPGSAIRNSVLNGFVQQKSSENEPEYQQQG